MCGFKHTIIMCSFKFIELFIEVEATSLDPDELEAVLLILLDMQDFNLNRAREL
jgi:hypothetical protein